MKLEALKPAYYSIFFFIFILLTGILGFSLIEKYPLIDAFFMTIITITTVGFGIMHPLSSAGKIFTSFLILFSFGFFAFSASTLTRYIVSGVFRNYFKYSKVKKEIDKLNNHVIVVGYGRNGSQAIEELKFHNIPVVVIENRESKIKEIQQKNDLLYIEDDPSSDEVLIGAGILRAKALISVLPTDEENLFVVLTSKALNPNLKTISRAINLNTIKKLKTAGASHVIMPDKISGQHMANMIAQPNVIEFMDYLMLEKSKDVVLDEVSCKEIDSHSFPSIQQLHLLCKENLNIIGIKRQDGRYIVNPSPETQMNSADHLFVLGQPLAIEQFKKAIGGKMTV